MARRQALNQANLTSWILRFTFPNKNISNNDDRITQNLGRAELLGYLTEHETDCQNTSEKHPLNSAILPTLYCPVTTAGCRIH